MAPVLRWAIEEIADWHANLYVEPHVVAFVAVARRYSASPARFDVECSNVASRWLGGNAECRLEVSWQDDTAAKAAKSETEPCRILYRTVLWFRFVAAQRSPRHPQGAESISGPTRTWRAKGGVSRSSSRTVGSSPLVQTATMR